MAVQVIDDPSRRSGGFGSALGRGLTGILQGLAQRKLQEYGQRQQASRISQGLSALGMPEEVSSRIAVLPPKLQEMVLTQFFGSQASVPQAPGDFQGAVPGVQPEVTSPLEAALSPDQLQQDPGLTPEQMLIGQGQAPQGVDSLMSQLSPDTQQALQQAVEQQTGQAPVPPVAAPVIAKAKPRIPAGASPRAKQGLRLQAKPTRRKSFQELLATPRPTKADRAKAEDMAFKRRRQTFAEQKDVDKQTQKSYDKILDEAKDARANDMRLNRMKKLNNEGVMTTPMFASVLNTLKKGVWGVGIDLKFLQSPDSQEFDKLSKDFLKNAKSIFGARVTEGEIRMFLETIPTLTQTQEGRRRVIRNMKMLNEASKVRKSAMIDVIDMNGGERPKNMEVVIEKKIGPKLDRLSRGFEFGKISKLGKVGKAGRELTTTASSIVKDLITGLIS